MFIINRKKYDEKVKEIQILLEDKEMLEKIVIAQKNKLNKKDNEIKLQKKIISQYERKLEKNSQTIEHFTKEIINLQNENTKKEMLRKKAAGKVGGLIASLNRKERYVKELQVIIKKQLEENQKFKNKIIPPTKQELENYKLFGSRNGKRRKENK